MSNLVASPREFAGTERYVVRRRLGAGGMGIVYEAFDRRRGHPIAIKTLGNAFDPVSRHRFKSEFRALSDLSHPNLAALYELDLAVDPPFFTMELIDGVDFLRYVRPDGQLSIDRLRAALAQLTAGLGALHRSGKLHRDIKPTNVLVTDAGRVVLLDFGLVLELDPKERITRGGAAGTLAYMAPEQALGGRLDPAADWYAVGVMLYEALSGTSPHLDDASGSFDGEWIVPRPPRGEHVPGELSDLCVALLSRDPSARPGEAEILARVANAPLPEVPASAGSSLLIGRARELEALERALEETHRGQPVLVHLRGRSGMGKSTLARRFLERIAPRAMVLSGRCREQEHVPYKAFDGLVDDLVRQLSKRDLAEVDALLPRNLVPLLQIFPAFERIPSVARAQRRMYAVPDVHELRRRGFEALREMLGRIAERTELVLFIDDLQWSDRESAILLEEIVRPPDPPALLAILAYRSEDAAGAESLPATTVLELAGLAETDAVELARSLAVNATPIVLERIARESGGSPLFVQELAELAARGTELGAPTLDELIRRKVRDLPAPAIELLALIAVAGEPLSHAALERAANLGADHPKMIGALKLARLIRSTGPAGDDTVEAYHHRVREVIANDLAPEESKRCHARLAEALSHEAEIDPERMAHHLDGAGDRARASAAWEDVGRRAFAALAFDRAVHAFRRSLELADDQDARRIHSLLLELGESLVHSGRGVEAANVFLRAASSAEEEERIALHHRAGEQLLASGHLDEGMKAFAPVLEATDLADRDRTPMIAMRRLLLRLRRRASEPQSIAPGRLLRIDVAWSLSTGLAIHDPMRAFEFHTRSLCDAYDAGDPVRLSRSFAAEASFLGTISKRRPKRVAVLFAEARRLAESTNDPQAVAFVIGAEGVEAAMRARWREAFDRCERAEAMLLEHCTGVAWLLGTARHFGLLGRLMHGDLDVVRSRVPSLVRDANERSDTYLACYLDGSFAAFTDGFLADAPDETLRITGDAMRRWPSQRFNAIHFWAMWNRVSALLYREDPDALAEVEDLFRRSAESRLLDVRHGRIEATFLRARAHLLAGDRRAALEDARWLAREPQARTRGYAHLVRAGASDDPRDHLEAATHEMEEAEMLLHRAAAQWTLGRLIDGDRGRALVRESEDWMRARGVASPARIAALFAPSATKA